MSYLLYALAGVAVVIMVWVFNNHAWGGLRALRDQTAIFEKHDAAARKTISDREDADHRARERRIENRLRRVQSFRKHGIRPQARFDSTASERMRRG